MNRPAGLIVCLALLISACPVAGESSEATMKSNVSYGSVTALEFTPANEKLIYGNDDPALQYGMLWLPDKLEAGRKAPLIVFIHGGCWLNAYDIRHSFPLTSALAQAGYGVWSLEYRRTGDAGGGWPGSLDDVKQGLAFASTLTDYPLDLDRIVVMGHSAGGHLALLAASENKSVEGVIGLAAITDIVAYSQGANSCQAAAIDFMGGDYESRPAAWEAANPAGQSLPGNTLLLQGDMDTIVPVGQSQLPGAATLMAKGAGHFDWIHPDTGAYRLLMERLDDVFR